MFQFKKAISLLLSLCILFVSLTLPSYAEDGQISVSAQSAVLMEANSKTAIYSKNADTPLPMASTTKIMTALVALELASPDTVITVDASAVGIEGSSVYLFEGEKLTLEQLLYALLLESANDAAVAIAVGISGSVEAFAAEMNRKAEDLGLLHTHFTNPHGLDDEGHYTTAYELALIARELLQNPLLRTITSTRKITIPHSQSEGGRLLVNHNKMLRMYDGCIGVKTGFTRHSGRCLVSAAERNGVTMIAVTLNAPNDWNDHTKLLDSGFAQYQSLTLCQKNEIQYTLHLINGTEENVLLSNPETLSLTLPKSCGKIRVVIECRRFEYAPIQSKEIAGQAVFYCDTDRNGKEEAIAFVPLIATKTVEQLPKKNWFIQWWQEIFS